MNGRQVGYWICTVLLVVVFLPGGIFQTMRAPQSVAGFVRLGFPVYFVVFLGVWKILGSLAIVWPGFGLLKEWAYAGMLFDLTGAAVANAATHAPFWHVFVPLAICWILYGSWALRPESRRVAASTAVVG